MNTKVLKLGGEGEYRNAIREGARCLAAGGLVVFPTETVYGLGASVTNPAAMARLREVKQRGDDRPFTVHIGERSAVGRFVPDLRGLGRRLTERAWPGPLTLIFQVGEIQAVPVIRETSTDHAGAMYHNGTIGIRCPDDRRAACLLTEAREPVVAASANPAGASAPVDADGALAALDGRVDLVLDGGKTRYAKPSTIVHLNATGYHIVREGVLDRQTIQRLTSVNILLVCTGNTCRSPMGEGLLRRILAEHLGCREHELAARGYHVESAGTGAASGGAASPGAVEAMRTRGIDITGHVAKPLALDQINRADHILAMTGGHVDTVISKSADARDRTMRIDEVDIEDPIGGDNAVYARCAERIEKALRRRLKEISL